MYVSAADLPEGEQRIPLKTIHLNRSPVIATTKLLDDEVSKRIRLDVPKARQHYQQLMGAVGLEAKLVDVFSQQDLPQHTDPDLMLYSGGFFSRNDKNTMMDVRNSSPEELRDNTFHFEDQRFSEMLFRYRGRNYPESLTEEEQMQWQEYCYQRITDADSGASITMEPYLEKLESMLAEPNISQSDRKILEQLQAYADRLLG